MGDRPPFHFQSRQFSDGQCPQNKTERTGFEPADQRKPVTDLANRRIRPLCHLSRWRIPKADTTLILGKRPRSARPPNHTKRGHSSMSCDPFLSTFEQGSVPANYWTIKLRLMPPIGGSPQQRQPAEKQRTRFGNRRLLVDLDKIIILPVWPRRDRAASPHQVLGNLDRSARK